MVGLSQCLRLYIFVVDGIIVPMWSWGVCLFVLECKFAELPLGAIVGV